MNMFIGFFNSNFFIALITLAVGLAAFIIYVLQKRDQKKDAANIILLEIKSAERAIKKLRDSLLQEQLADIFLMPSESWTKYKYLFVRDFDRDEWDAITEFYNKCQLIDDDIRYNTSAFWNDVEAIRSNKQRILADYSEKYVSEINKVKTQEEEEIIIEKFKKSADKFNTLYMERQIQFAYNPQKPINDAKAHLEGLSRNLSQTAVGLKLKKLAKN